MPHAALTIFGRPFDLGLAWQVGLFTVLLLGTVVSLARDFRAGRRLARRGARTSGVVTGRVVVTDRPGAPVYRAVVTFATHDGKTVRVTMEKETVYPTRRGTRVPVLYDPADPADARVDRVWQRGPVASIVFIVALLTFLVLWLALAFGDGMG